MNSEKQAQTGIKSCGCFCCCHMLIIHQAASFAVKKHNHKSALSCSEREWMNRKACAKPKKNIILSLLQSFANSNGTKVISLSLFSFCFDNSLAAIVVWAFEWYGNEKKIGMRWKIGAKSENLWPFILYWIDFKCYLFIFATVTVDLTCSFHLSRLRTHNKKIAT